MKSDGYITSNLRITKLLDSLSPELFVTMTLHDLPQRISIEYCLPSLEAMSNINPECEAPFQVLSPRQVPKNLQILAHRRLFQKTAIS